MNSQDVKVDGTRCISASLREKSFRQKGGTFVLLERKWGELGLVLTGGNGRKTLPMETLLLSLYSPEILLKVKGGLDLSKIC